MGIFEIVMLSLKAQMKLGLLFPLPSGNTARVQPKPFWQTSLFLMRVLSTRAGWTDSSRAAGLLEPGRGEGGGCWVAGQCWIVLPHGPGASYLGYWGFVPVRTGGGNRLTNGIFIPCSLDLSTLPLGQLVTAPSLCQDLGLFLGQLQPSPHGRTTLEDTAHLMDTGLSPQAVAMALRVLHISQFVCAKPKAALSHVLLPHHPPHTPQNMWLLISQPCPQAVASAPTSPGQGRTLPKPQHRHPARDAAHSS